MEDERRFAWQRGNHGLIGLLLGIFVVGPALLYLQFSGIFPIVRWQPHQGAHASTPIAGTLAAEVPPTQKPQEPPKPENKKKKQKKKK